MDEDESNKAKANESREKKWSEQNTNEKVSPSNPNSNVAKYTKCFRYDFKYDKQLDVLTFWSIKM